MSKTEFSAGTIACGAALASLGLLMLRYPDRAVFDEHGDDLPRQPGYPLLGVLPDTLKNVKWIHDFISDFQIKNGLRTYRVSSFGRPVFIQTIDPRNIEHILKTNFENYIKGPDFNGATHDLLGHGIFNSNGDRWRYQRKTASLIFNGRNFRDLFTKVFVEEIQLLSDKVLSTAQKENTTVDFFDLILRFTLESFVRIGFGVQLHSIDRDEPLPFSTAFDYCERHVFDLFVKPYARGIDAFVGVFMPWKNGYYKQLNTINEFAASVIETRHHELEKGEEFNDLLSLFMSTKNEEGNALNQEELRDVVMNFIIAGRNTTAQALSWGLYCLLMHPRVEKKLVEEINACITDDMETNPPELYETVMKMTYAHAVLYEVLRLYPPVPMNQKYSLADDVLPDGTQIHKGDYISYSVYGLGRSTEVWGSDAAQFRPERWISPTGDLIRASQSQWPVFHAGPRVCLGQRLGTLEALVAMSLLLRRFQFKLDPGQEITYQASATLPMRDGMKVHVEKRSS